MLSGFYLRLGTTLDEAVNARVHALARSVLHTPHAALTDIIPGYSTLYLEYDSCLADERELRRWLGTRPTDKTPQAGTTVRLKVRYDGPDLETVAQRTGLSVAEVVARHSARPYNVYAVGFTPGLAFMGALEPALHVPRRSAPRPRVDAGTVAIANAQTTVYPVASPGGWQLLGRVHEPVYDPLADTPLLLQAGDRVQFVASREDPPAHTLKTRELLPPEPHTPFLRVQEAGLLDLVVDGGRFRAGRFGFARSGPLDAASAARANRLVGNSPGAPLLELNLGGGLYEVVTPGVVALCGGGLEPVLNGSPCPLDVSFAVDRGDRLWFRPAARGSRAYLAVAGSLEVQTFRGSASPDLRGRIGRALASGDVLGVAQTLQVRPGRTFGPYTGPGSPLRLIPGPQASAEALGALTRQTFSVGRADRMGLQLLGGEVPGGEVVSEAVPIGSVQVPPGGTPLLLLQDRGTLGGYSKPAVLHPADLPRAAQLRPGESVRFRAL